MRQSLLFGKTSKVAPKGATSKNHELLVRGGFVYQEMAGVFSYLPLGLRVLKHVENIVREEMNAIGAQELLMPVLHPKERWTTTGRWDSVDVLFKLQSRHGAEFALGSTHEEIITPLVAHFVHSYKDLPVALYQIQTKFRDEPRAKSGILRGREFGMKDLYSFHTSQEDLEKFYARVITAYQNIFRRLELPVKIIEASGGDFTKKFSHEFSVLTPSGEDTIVYCENCSFARNTEILGVQSDQPCPTCGNALKQAKAIEAANIFDLGTRFTEATHLMYTDAKGIEYPAIMGCYGFGTSRMMGTIVEARHDQDGIVWPMSVAPFSAHVLELKTSEEIHKRSRSLVSLLEKHGIEVLWDDRDVRPGEKLRDADLIGIPVQLRVGEKNPDQLEWKQRDTGDVLLLEPSEALTKFSELLAQQ